jgi:hypothetical protein
LERRPILTGLASFLPSLRMVAEDHTLRPPVRLRIRDDGGKDGTPRALSVELRACNEREARFETKAIRRGEPLGIILERGALASPFLIVAKHAYEARFFTDVSPDGASHSGLKS